MKAWKILTTIIVTVMGVSLMASCSVMADGTLGCDDNRIPDEAKEAMGCKNGEEAFPNAIKIILNSVIGVGGVVAMAYVIVGGVKYMTSNGDAGKVKSAKETILYALIGLVVTATAFALTNWAIEKIDSGDTAGNNVSAVMNTSD